MSRNFRVSIRGGSAFDGASLPRLLSDEELAAIAEDVRTKPPAEAARHLMPLLHHIAALEDSQREAPMDVVPREVPSE